MTFKFMGHFIINLILLNVSDQRNIHYEGARQNITKVPELRNQIFYKTQKIFISKEICLISPWQLYSRNNRLQKSSSPTIQSMYNRGIKTLRTKKTKLPLQIYMHSLIITIGQLRLVQLTNKKTGQKNVNKQIIRPFHLLIK